MYILLLPLAITALLTAPMVYRFKHYEDGRKAKNTIIVNICSFFAVLLLAAALPVGGLVSAETAAAAEGAAAAVSSDGLAYIAAALAVGLGSIGCGIAVANAAPAAIGAVSEDPKCFGKAMIFVALGEGVALYGFLIAMMIISNVG
ncbi:MAG: ATP synthase subunit C [Huintestinicola sp.]